jgi:formylglycine-generating enzyme required for sulfatase activity
MASGRGDRLKVFISYSRRDSSEFVDELFAGLELAGFAPFLDRHDIVAGEKWEERLGGLITQADTIVFVVSPEAVKSDRCAWEVDRAVAQSKRLLPVIFKPVPEPEIPEELRSRQFVRFDGAAGLARPLGQLAEALRQDIDWIREHTRLSELAARWELRGRPDALLLRGDDLAAAEAWADKWSPDALRITDAIRDLIAGSKQAEAAFFESARTTQRRMRRSRVITGALLTGVVVGVVGWINQSTLVDAWRWWTVTRPYLMSQVRPYVLSAAKEAALTAGNSFKECAQDCPEMIVVPAGAFTMGSPPGEKGSSNFEHPQHTVVITKPFAVSKFELTFADWDACVTGGGCNGYKPDDQPWGRGQQPVINVNWNDAQAYVAWLSAVTGKTYRLLSEAEYEYAARAGTTTAYPWGDEINRNGAAMANCDGCGSKWDAQQTAPVGSFAPNKFGLYDVVGNVWAWTEDCVHNNYNDAPTDGSAWLGANGGDCGSHRLRGGSWNFSSGYLRTAFRGGHTTVTRDAYCGFRVARMLLAQ